MKQGKCRVNITTNNILFSNICEYNIFGQSRYCYFVTFMRNRVSTISCADL